MKIKCDFCKTEYAIDHAPNGAVKCAICGHTWNVTVPARKNSWLMLFASVCALLSAAIFTFVVIAQYQIKKANQETHLICLLNIVFMVFLRTFLYQPKKLSACLFIHSATLSTPSPVFADTNRISMSGFLILAYSITFCTLKSK